MERIDDGVAERWVLLPGFEERCTALYQEVQNKGVKLEDQTDGSTIVEKGILTRTREHMVDFMRFKADKKAAEAAAKSDVKEELEEQAKDFEDKAQEQQKIVKSLLEQSQQAKPEDVLYGMMQLHRKGEDSSNAFKAAFQAFGVTWDRKTKAPEKVPA